MKLARLAVAAVLFAVALGSAAPLRAAASPDAWCGTHPAGLAALTAEHRAFDRFRQRERDAGRLAIVAAPIVSEVGNVAVIDDDGTLVTGPNPFDQHGRSIVFQSLKKGKRIIAQRGGDVFVPVEGTRLALGDDAAVEVRFPAGFRFPFGNEMFTSAFVHSDGNLTFGAPDADSTARSLSRLLGGPKRIAAFFADLDPSQVTGAEGVFVDFPGNRVRVTWQGVPQFGTTNRNDVQLTLAADGRIAIAYGGRIDAAEAVVGVAPYGPIDLELIDFSSELPFRPKDPTAIAEVFSPDPQRDDFGIVRTFLGTFADVYTHAVIWLDFPGDLGGGAFAFEANIKNQIEGIGLPLFDRSGSVGSRGVVESLLQMGAISNYPDDPDEVFLGTNSTMGVLGQEAGHRWLAFPTFSRGAEQMSTRLLGRDFAHWSYFMDSDGSVMEGNDIVDQGGGFFVTTAAATSRYSRLDQYIMGLRPPAQVPPFFFVANPTGVSRQPSSAPEANVSFQGVRVDVRVQDVVAAEGARVPKAKKAPKVFNMAFIVVGRQGEPVSAASIAKVDAFRRRWEAFFNAATDGLGRVVTTLRRR